MRPFLRRLGRVVFYGIALLAITACATLFYFRYVQHRRSGEAQRLLDEADGLAWSNQWLKAEPVYQQAERLFYKNDASGALYAHVSQIIPHAESRSLPATILGLTDDLKLPAAQDPETRLRVLTIRGMIEVNYDAAMARDTWSQVAKLASQQGHLLQASRAVGEEGIAAFLLGDLKSAKTKVLAAWETAKIFHDDAAHVRYASVYGAGLNELHRYKEALTALDDAINTAARNPAVAYQPILALIHYQYLTYGTSAHVRQHQNHFRPLPCNGRAHRSSKLSGNLRTFRLAKNTRTTCSGRVPQVRDGDFSSKWIGL